MILAQDMTEDYDRLTPFEKAELGLLAMAAKITFMNTMNEIVARLDPEVYSSLSAEEKQQIDDDIITLTLALEHVGISA